MITVNCVKLSKNFYLIQYHCPYHVKITLLTATVQSILEGNTKQVSFLIPPDLKPTTMKVISVDDKSFIAEIKNKKIKIIVDTKM